MNNELVTIEKYQFLPQAESARIAMQSEGIEAFLADAETVNTDWMIGGAEDEYGDTHRGRSGKKCEPCAVSGASRPR